MKKTIKFQIDKADHDKALAVKRDKGYQLSKIYEMAFVIGINELLKKQP
jgi:hypothetical protein